MSGPGAMRAVTRQIAALRDEEASEAAFFVLPDEGDSDVDWLNFVVQLLGPEKYSVNPKGDSADRPSPYADGLFHIAVKVPDTFPQDAPEIQFRTRVWHPNIHAETGKPCIDLLREQWKPTMTLRDVLVFIRELLAAPNAGDSVNSEAGREIGESLDTFEAHARDVTAKYATAS